MFCLSKELALEVFQVHLCCDAIKTDGKTGGGAVSSLYDSESFVRLECNSADHIKSQDSQHTPHSMTPSTATAPRSSTPSHGQTTAPEPIPAQKTPAKVVYVFSTEMANK